MRTLTLFLGVILGSPLLPAQTPPPQPVAFRIGSVRFDRPDGWSYSRPNDGVRAAQLETKAGATSLVITFTRFPPGSGGSVQANIDRWIGQFVSTETPSVIQKPDGTALSLTIVKISGTMRGGVPGGPTKDSPGSLLLGSILESQDGLVVVKLAGPKSAVSREEKIFTDLVQAAAGRAP